MQKVIKTVYNIKEIGSGLNDSRPKLIQLLSDNDIVINTLIEAYKLAENENEYGLANFLQDRIDIHKKHGWMLRATIRI